MRIPSIRRLIFRDRLPKPPRDRRPKYPFVIITSAMSLSRELWRYGEPHLAERALILPPDDVANIGCRAGILYLSGMANEIWPNGPGSKHVLLAVTEWIEGKPRPSSRVRRLAEKRLPPHLQATEAELWDASREVADAVQRMERDGTFSAGS